MRHSCDGNASCSQNVVDLKKAVQGCMYDLLKRQLHALCSYSVAKTGPSYTKGCLCLQQHLCASKCNADLKKLSDATLILFHVLHVKALMKIARIGAYHGGSQCDIQTKVPHQMG